MARPGKNVEGRIGSPVAVPGDPFLRCQGVDAVSAGIESLASAPCSLHQNLGVVRAGHLVVRGRAFAHGRPLTSDRLWCR